MTIGLKHLIVALSITLLGYHSLFGQTRISEKFDNEPLVKVLEKLSKNYKIKFAYDNTALGSTLVSGEYRNITIEDALNEILKPTLFDFILINNVYIIKQRVVEANNEPKVKPKVVKYKLLGVVKEKGTGENLPYATIAVEETNKGTSANSDGYFSLASSKSDSMILKVSYLGFKPAFVKLPPLNNDEAITIELERNSATITDVVVTVKKQNELMAVENSPGVIQWNSKKNSDLPSLSNLDVVAPLQLLPGIDGTTESLSGLMIRHSASDKNLFIYDGFTIYHIDHFFGAFTSFNSKAIKDIRVSRGGFDSHWGGRASSVVEITGKTGNENKLVADFGTDQLSSDIELDGPIGKRTTFVFAARRSFTDVYHSDLYYNLFESARSDLVASKRVPTSLSVDPDKPNFYYYDLNAKLSFKPSTKDIISISGYKGYDDMALDETETVPIVNENSNWGNYGAGIRWARQWNGIFYHSLTAGASRYSTYYDHIDYKLRKKLAGNEYDTIRHVYLVKNHIDDFNMNFNGELKLGTSNSLEFGVDENNVSIGSMYNYQYTTLGVKVIDTLRQYDNRMNNLTFWAQDKISVGPLKSLRFGGRVTYNDLIKKYYFEPRVQFSLELSKRFSIKAASGIYYQFVNRILSSNPNSHQNIWKISNDKHFPVVKSKQLITGFNWDIGGGFSLDCEGYAKKTENISFEQIVVRKIATSKITQKQVILFMDNRTYGVDILLKKNWGKGQSWISYSLSKSLDKCEFINGGDEYPALDDHLHELKIANMIDLKHWNFTAVWIYSSGNPWDEILLTNTLQLSPDYSKNNARLEPYHRLDLGVSYSFKMLNADTKLGVKFFNLYNHVNTISKPTQLSDTPYQDYLEGKSIFVYPEVPGMGFTTSFFINIRF